MSIERSSEYVLLTGTAHPKLANKIGELLEQEVYQSVKKIFADGERDIQIPTNVRNRDVFIIQPTCTPHTDSYIAELLFIIQAARLASAREITAVLPYFGYGRQDRKDRPRVAVAAHLIANLIQFSGADRIVTVDIHNETLTGTVSCPWDNVYASWSFVPVVKSLNLSDLVVVSPDKGGVTKALAYATRLGSNKIAIVYKNRDVNVANESQTLGMIGDVEGKDTLIVDDILDTAGTLTNAAALLKERGANRILAAITHGVFSHPATKRIDDSVIERVYVTDTIPANSEVAQCPKIKIVPIAPLLAGVINCIYKGDSISQKFIL